MYRMYICVFSYMYITTKGEANNLTENKTIKVIWEDV